MPASTRETKDKTGLPEDAIPSRAQRTQSLVQWLVPICVALLGWWAYTRYTAEVQVLGSWGCEMSWMTPSYIPFQVPSSKVPRYQLYLYREHGWDLSNIPSGKPVISIPGNAGSYQQARSVASAASRQYHTNRKTLPETENGPSIDLFTVDLNEDFSALSGGLIEQQANFLLSSIDTVLSSYNHLTPSSRPKAVTLLGHSMGGIVARLAAAQLNDSRVDAIITMSTPHLIPPVTLDARMQSVYRLINRPLTDASPILVSICGGLADTQIASDGCALSKSILGPDQGFAVFTSAIPGAWTNVDHQAIVWCHQVRWQVAAALLEMARYDDRQIQLGVARRYLLGDRKADRKAAEVEERTVIARFKPLGRSVSVILHGGQVDDNDYAGDFIVKTCVASGHCRVIDHEAEAIPWPSNPTAPFPSPGEGIGDRDIAFSLSFQVSDITQEVVIEGKGPWKALPGHNAQHQAKSAIWVAQNDHITHHTISFSHLAATSLDRLRLEVKLGECRGHTPMIRFWQQPHPDLAGITHEHQFFSAHTPNFAPHTHVWQSPYLFGYSFDAMVEVDIYQDPSCPVTELHLDREPGFSLFILSTRLRMPLLAWMTGWAAALLAFQFWSLRATGEIPGFYQACTPRRIGGVLLGVAVIDLTTSAMGAHTLVLGITSFRFLPLTLLLAMGSLGIVATLWSLLLLLRRILRPIRSAKTELHTAKAIWRWLAASLVVTVVLALVLPPQLIFGVYLLVRLITILLVDIADRSHQEWVGSMLLLYLTLLPFSGAAMAVYARAALASLHHLPPSSHALPELLLMVLAMEMSIASKPQGGKRSDLTAGALLFGLVGIFGLTWGGRYTILLPRVIALAMLAVCKVCWPR